MTKEEKIKVGEVVQLKSGGPEMTVVGFTTFDTILCAWFADGKPFEKDFPENALEKIPDSDFIAMNVA